MHVDVIDSNFSEFKCWSYDFFGSKQVLNFIFLHFKMKLWNVAIFLEFWKAFRKLLFFWWDQKLLIFCDNILFGKCLMHFLSSSFVRSIFTLILSESTFLCHFSNYFARIKSSVKAYLWAQQKLFFMILQFSFREKIPFSIWEKLQKTNNSANYLLSNYFILFNSVRLHKSEKIKRKKSIT